MTFHVYAVRVHRWAINYIFAKFMDVSENLSANRLTNSGATVKNEIQFFGFVFVLLFCSVVNDLSLFVPQLPVCNDCSFILILHRATTNAVVHINNRLRRDNKR